MSAAVERAAAAWSVHTPRIANLYVEGQVAPRCLGCDFTVPETDSAEAWHGAFIIHRQEKALAAALDVEEMAGALYVSEHPYDTLENWRDHGSEQSKAVYYRLATAVRASILGES